MMIHICLKLHGILLVDYLVTTQFIDISSKFHEIPFSDYFMAPDGWIKRQTYGRMDLQKTISLCLWQGITISWPMATNKLYGNSSKIQFT